ncbi:hypothetical protein FE257_000816 [Aspergillus nanangensis]|uniref:Xylanolytic transcriptional activator regulatory domain-containing protein n=1 Tax=Aspergillus nanangensis TaxID=2582783 RepID=A0AAD4CEW2_ASPNN|nr:hypothetical protein FE257_000816 [Aspergillus nanangensis]
MYLHQLVKFFHVWSSIWPILMKKQLLDSFHRIFDRIEQGDTHLSGEDVTSLRQIFLLLSITSCHDHAHDDSRMYYDCAFKCAHLCPQTGDLSELQSILLTSLYLQLTRQHAPWIGISGQAVRLAQSLGLHRHSRRFKFCAGEVELRKRIWWCVYAVDIACSIVHGLPKMIQDEDVDTDLPIDADLDDSTTADLPLPLPGEPTNMEIFISYIRLLKIISACLKSLYTTTKRRNGVTKITTLDQELSVWRNSIGHLQPRGAERDEELVEGPRTNSNYHYFEMEFLGFLSNVALLLIHQPALTFDQKHPQFMKSLSTCVNAGSNILRTLDHNKDDIRLHCLLPNRSSIVFKSALMCFYHHWICTSLSLTPTVDLDMSLEKISNIATRLLQSHKVELGGPGIDTTSELDRHTLSTAIHLIWEFWSHHEAPRTASFSPHQSTPRLGQGHSTYFHTQAIGIDSAELGANSRPEASMEIGHVDLGILDEGLLDFDWL